MKYNNVAANHHYTDGDNTTTASEYYNPLWPMWAYAPTASSDWKTASTWTCEKASGSMPADCDSFTMTYDPMPDLWAGIGAYHDTHPRIWMSFEDTTLSNGYGKIGTANHTAAATPPADLRSAPHMLSSGLSSVLFQGPSGHTPASTFSDPKDAVCSWGSGTNPCRDSSGVLPYALTTADKHHTLWARPGFTSTTGGATTNWDSSKASFSDRLPSVEGVSTSGYAFNPDPYPFTPKGPAELFRWGNTAPIGEDVSFSGANHTFHCSGDTCSAGYEVILIP